MPFFDTNSNNQILQLAQSSTSKLGKYDTALSPEEELKFQDWKKKNAPNDAGNDYDLRGAYQAGLSPAANGHWPDTFKKPNHPTFSVESKYSYDAPEKAGWWNGDTYVPPTAENKRNAFMDLLDSAISGSERK